MCKIKIMRYGFKLTFSDFVRAEEMQNWAYDSMLVLVNAINKFGIFVDMINLNPLFSDSQKIMVEVLALYRH